jgi:hypothetical protein
LLQRLERELVGRDGEIATLKETLQSRLTMFDSNSDREASVTQIITENHRLRDDKTRLWNLLSDRQSAYNAEILQLRETVSKQ